MNTDMHDPRIWEFRRALAAVNAGLRAPVGAHERYRQAIGPYCQAMAEMTPSVPLVRREMMRALYQSGLPLGPILFAYRASEAEESYVIEHPPVVPEPVDEQQRLSRLSYGMYLGTAHWKQVRADALRRAQGRCALCNASAGLQVHHRNYERRGAERPADVIVLCDDCHGRHHGKLRAA